MREGIVDFLMLRKLLYIYQMSPEPNVCKMIDSFGLLP